MREKAVSVSISRIAAARAALVDVISMAHSLPSSFIVSQSAGICNDLFIAFLYHFLVIVLSILLCFPERLGFIYEIFKTC